LDELASSSKALKNNTGSDPRTIPRLSDSYGRWRSALSPTPRLPLVQQQFCLQPENQFCARRFDDPDKEEGSIFVVQRQSRGSQTQQPVPVRKIGRAHV